MEIPALNRSASVPASVCSCGISLRTPFIRSITASDKVFFTGKNSAPMSCFSAVTEFFTIVSMLSLVLA